APEADAEQEGPREDRGPRGAEDEQRDGRGDDRVDEQHYVLLRPPIGEPAHEQPSHEAAHEDDRGYGGGASLVEASVEAQVELQVLDRTPHRADRTEDSEREEVEGGLTEDARDGWPRGAGRGRDGGGLANEERGGEGDHDH